MKRKQLEKEIGTLSNPSKMPAFAWGISAKKCITGAKLAKIKGTICNKCYALKGHYAFKNVFDAHELRRKAIEKNEWVDYMAELITQKYKNLDKSRLYHRWFDSGVHHQSFGSGHQVYTKINLQLDRNVLHTNKMVSVNLAVLVGVVKLNK
jgi:hypothetical protein